MQEPRTVPTCLYLPSSLDLLNDEFKLPPPAASQSDDLLQHHHPRGEAKKARVIYINPYASVGNKLQITRLGKIKKVLSVIYDKYYQLCGRCLFYPFRPIPGTSTWKSLAVSAKFFKVEKFARGSDFSKFRSVFQDRLRGYS